MDNFLIGFGHWILKQHFTSMDWKCFYFPSFIPSIVLILQRAVRIVKIAEFRKRL
jgi:hypothetical protein